MRVFYCSVILLLISEFISAQTFIGKVLDTDNQPMPFTNVILITLPDSVFSGGVTTDDKGFFSITANCRANNYLLKISFLGCEPFSKMLDVNTKQDLGEIILKTNEVQLQGVSVVAQLPKIRYEKGTYIADIENSMAAKGNTVESLLNQLPGLWASTNGISVFGKTITVYINNRQVNLLGETLMKYLQNIRSEDISKIEIMQSASAEFSAEGSGGVIRIITKRINDEGWNITVSPTISYQNYYGISPYFSLQYGKGKFGAWLTLNGENSKWLSQIEENSQDFVMETNYNTTGTDTIFDHNYSTALTLNYDFNRYNKLVFNAYYMYWGKGERFNKITNISGNTLTDSINNTQTNQQTEQNMYNYSFTVNYDLLLDSLGKSKITLLADYVNQYKYNVKDYMNYLNKNEAGNLISNENFLNDQNKPYQIYSTEVRYKHDLGKYGSGLTGIKYGYSSVYDEFSYYEKILNDWQLKPEIGYNYHYEEQLLSGFYRYDLAKGKWAIVAGLRGEYSNGKAKGLGDNINRFDLFPSFYYDYTLNEHHGVGFSYTRRINRISYFTLLPQRFYSSRYSIFEGNPNLKPDILNNFNFNYNIDQKYYLSMGYTLSNNALSRYSKTELINNQSILVSTYTDGFLSRNFNVNVYVPIKFTSWWSSTNQVEFHVDSYKTQEDKFCDFNYSLFTQHNYNLPYGIRGQILYRYSSQSKNAYLISYPYHLLSVSLQKSMLKNEVLNVKIEANRLILNKNGQEIRTSQAFEQYYMYGKNPLFQLTLSYSFNDGKVKQIQEVKNSNEQEKNRTY